MAKLSRQCAVEGCERPRFCKGMCGMHYRRMYAHGTTDLLPRTPRPKEPAVPCRVTGCSAPARTTGLCTKHYARARAGRPFTDTATRIANLPGEEWRPVVGAEGRYAVSNLGRVRSLPHYYSTARETSRWNPGRVLRPTVTNHYYSVEMTKGCVARVHRLVAAAFIGPRPEGHEVNHINGEKLDNRAANLEYATGSQNMYHAYATGLQAPVRGERHGNATITEEQARYIWRMKGQCTQRDLATEIGCGVSVVAGIHCGKRWRHVQG